MTATKDPLEVRLELERAGKAHRRATARQAVTRNEMYDAIRAARATDLSMVAVAALAGRGPFEGRRRIVSLPSQVEKGK